MARRGSVLKGLTVEINGETSNLQAELNRLRDKSKEVSGDLRLVNELLKLDPKNTKLLAEQMSLLEKQTGTAREKVTVLRQAISDLDTAYKDGKVDATTYTEAHNQLTSDLKRAEYQLEKNEKKLELYQEATKRTQEATKRTHEENVKFRDGLREVNKACAEVAAGLAVVIGASAKVGATFEKNMSQVAATLGTTIEQIPELTSLARELGESTIYTASEAAEGINYLAQAGFESKDIIAALPAVLDLAVSGNMELGEASEMAANAMNVLGYKAEDIDKIVDVLAVTATAASGDVSDFGEALLDSGAQAKLVGMDLNDTAVALGILADNGIKGSEGGTKLRNVLQDLFTPTDKAKKAMKDLGVETSDSEGNMRSARDVLLDLGKALDGLTEADRATAMNDIFDTRNIAPANALIENAGELWEELSTKINASQGAASRMADTMQDNLSGSLTKLKSAAQEAGIAFYEKFGDRAKDEIDGVTETVRKLADSLANGRLDTLLRILASSIVGIGAAVAVLNIVMIVRDISAVAHGVEATTKVVGTLQKVISGAGNPWWLLAAAIAAVAAALITYQSEVDKNSAATKLKNQLDETNESWANLKSQQEDYLKSTAGEFKTIDDLRDRLTKLVDENGNVIGSKDELKRVIQELKNHGIDVEIGAIDNQIEKYDELIQKIDETIAKKKYDTLIAGMGDAYSEALTNKSTSYRDMAEALTELNKQEDILAQKEQDYQDKIDRGIPMDTSTEIAVQASINKQRKKVDALKQTYDDAKGTYQGYLDTIETYQTAETLMWEGHTTEAVELMTDYYRDVNDVVESGQEAQESTIEASYGRLQQMLNLHADFVRDGNEAMIAGSIEEIKAAAKDYEEAGGVLPENFIKGIENGTVSVEDAAAALAAEAAISGQVRAGKGGTAAGAEFSNSASKGIRDGKSKIADASSDAITSAAAVAELKASSKGSAIGRALIDGLIGGMSSKMASAASKAASVVANAVAAAKKAGDIHSPSKKTEWIGKMLGEGMALGIEKESPTVSRAAIRMVTGAVSNSSVSTNNLSVTNNNNFAAATPASANAMLRQLNRNLGLLYGGTK